MGSGVLCGFFADFSRAQQKHISKHASSGAASSPGKGQGGRSPANVHALSNSIAASVHKASTHHSALHASGPGQGRARSGSAGGARPNVARKRSGSGAKEPGM